MPLSAPFLFSIFVSKSEIVAFRQKFFGISRLDYFLSFRVQIGELQYSVNEEKFCFNSIRKSYMNYIPSIVERYRNFETRKGELDTVTNILAVFADYSVFSFVWLWHFRNFPVVGSKEKFLKKFLLSFGKIALRGGVGSERNFRGLGKLPNRPKCAAFYGKDTPFPMPAVIIPNSVTDKVYPLILHGQRLVVTKMVTTRIRIFFSDVN